MEFVWCLVALALVFPAAVYYLSGFGSRAAEGLLEASFATQRALAHGKHMPASDLLVVHRWRTHAATDRRGAFLAVDANWLCRTPEGLYVLAIAQGSEGMWKLCIPVGTRKPPEIRWTWRSLSEDHVRRMLTATPRLHKKVFGGVS